MKMFLIAWIFLLGIAFLVLAFFIEPIMMVGSYIVMSLVMLAWGSLELKKEIDMKMEEEMEVTEELLNEIPHTKFTLSEDLLTSLLIDEKTNTLYVAKRDYTDEEFDFRAYPFSKLLEVAVLEDDDIKYLFPKEGIIGGTITEEGNSIFNLIDSEELEYEEDEGNEEVAVKKIALKLVVDDFSNHTIEYVFLESDEPLDRDSVDFKECIKECTNWYKIISIAINQYKHEKRLVGPWV